MGSNLDGVTVFASSGDGDAEEAGTSGVGGRRRREEGRGLIDGRPVRPE